MKRMTAEEKYLYSLRQQSKALAGPPARDAVCRGRRNGEGQETRGTAYKTDYRQ
jgi:hypothetical protein